MCTCSSTDGADTGWSSSDSASYIGVYFVTALTVSWVKLLAVSVTWFIYGQSATLKLQLDYCSSRLDWITYPFGLYSTTITDVADPNGTLYTSIGWGCLINAFYIVSLPCSVSTNLIERSLVPSSEPLLWITWDLK